MRLGPAASSNADYEGLYLYSYIDEDGLTGEGWTNEEGLERLKQDATRTILVKGQVKDGKLNGVPIETIERTKESGW